MTKMGFDRAGLILVKNVGMNKIGKFMLGAGVGTMMLTALDVAFPNKIRIIDSKKGEKIQAVVGATLTAAGLIMNDMSEHRNMLTAPKESMVVEFKEYVDSLPEV